MADQVLRWQANNCQGRWPRTNDDMIVPTVRTQLTLWGPCGSLETTIASHWWLVSETGDTGEIRHGTATKAGATGGKRNLLHVVLYPLATTYMRYCCCRVLRLSSSTWSAVREGLENGWTSSPTRYAPAGLPRGLASVLRRSRTI